jgi:hypothetical protein
MGYRKGIKQMRIAISVPMRAVEIIIQDGHYGAPHDELL